jgi:hypothetical protein
MEDLMPRIIPTLGYPTRAAAVDAMDARGLTPTEIAQAIGDGVTANSVSVTLCHIRNGRRRAPATTRTVVFSVDILKSLRVHADARCISVNELVRRLIDHIVGEDLVDSVLDDGEGSASDG